MTLRRPDEEGNCRVSKKLPKNISFAFERRLFLISSCFLFYRPSFKLLQIPVDPEAIHASMILKLRLTRAYSLAKLFAEKGEITALHNLEQE